jgi:hypothetical protein
MKKSQKLWIIKAVGRGELLPGLQGFMILPKALSQGKVPKKLPVLHGRWGHFCKSAS